MSNILTIPVEQRVVPVPKAPGETKLYKESLSMISAGMTFGKLKALVMAGALYNIHEKALWRLEGVKNYSEWLSAIGVSERTDRRYRQIADGMKKMIAQEKGEELADDFLFTPKNIKEHFGECVKVDINVLKLADASRDLQQFDNYLNSTSDISATEAMKLVATGVKTTETEVLPAKEATDLLSRMKAKGYVWSHEHKRFENPDGSPLSVAQIGEFVQEDDVMDFIRQTKDTVESFKKSTYTRLNGFSIFFEAFLATTHSPESKRKVSEEVESLVKEAQTLAGEILEQLPEEHS